jgi:hypothetical protein
MSIVIFDHVEPDVFGRGCCKMGGRGVFPEIADGLRKFEGSGLGRAQIQFGGSELVLELAKVL